ncbi:hypothetical protein [Solitalea koreensis]|nr:hypothetical protein [Solitalea koreensis]
MKKFPILILISFFGFSAFAQDLQSAQNELNDLIKRRNELFQEWKRNENENNAFFGGKSKKDLQRIIETQQTIINIDNEIMTAIQKVEGQRSSAVIAKRDDLSERTLKFDQEQKRLQNLISQRNYKIRNQDEQLGDLEQRTKNLSYALFICVCLLVALSYFTVAWKK